MPDQDIISKVNAIVDRYDRDRGMIVSVLQDIQEEYRYLPKEALKQVSEALSVPMSQVFAVATFYKTLSLQPRGRHLINVCTGTACHVRGAEKIVEKMERSLGCQRGQTTRDMRFTLETVRCVGACAMGPIVIVDNQYSGNVKLDEVDDILKKYE
jgi:NADH-quinone oxidoreductase subunit E